TPTAAAACRPALVHLHRGRLARPVLSRASGAGRPGRGGKPGVARPCGSRVRPTGHGRPHRGGPDPGGHARQRHPNRETWRYDVTEIVRDLRRPRRSPRAVRTMTFSRRVRGLDETEVREFLAGLADEIEAADAERAALRAELDRLRA